MLLGAGLGFVTSGVVTTAAPKDFLVAFAGPISSSTLDAAGLLPNNPNRDEEVEEVLGGAGDSFATEAAGLATTGALFGTTGGEGGAVDDLLPNENSPIGGKEADGFSAAVLAAAGLVGSGVFFEATSTRGEAGTGAGFSLVRGASVTAEDLEPNTPLKNPLEEGADLELVAVGVTGFGSATGAA